MMATKFQRLHPCFRGHAKGLTNYFDKFVEDSHYYTSCFVRELLLLKDNTLVYSNNAVFFRLATLKQLIKIV